MYRRGQGYGEPTGSRIFGTTAGSGVESSKPIPLQPSNRPSSASNTRAVPATGDATLPPINNSSNSSLGAQQHPLQQSSLKARVGFETPVVAPMPPVAADGSSFYEYVSFVTTTTATACAYGRVCALQKMIVLLVEFHCNHSFLSCILISGPLCTYV